MQTVQFLNEELYRIYTHKEKVQCLIPFINAYLYREVHSRATEDTTSADYKGNCSLFASVYKPSNFPK